MVVNQDLYSTLKILFPGYDAAR